MDQILKIKLKILNLHKNTNAYKNIYTNIYTHIKNTFIYKK